VATRPPMPWLCALPSAAGVGGSRKPGRNELGEDRRPTLSSSVTQVLRRRRPCVRWPVSAGTMVRAISSRSRRVAKGGPARSLGASRFSVKAGMSARPVSARSSNATRPRLTSTVVIRQSPLLGPSFISLRSLQQTTASACFRTVGAFAFNLDDHRNGRSDGLHRPRSRRAGSSWQRASTSNRIIGRWFAPPAPCSWSLLCFLRPGAFLFFLSAALPSGSGFAPSLSKRPGTSRPRLSAAGYTWRSSAFRAPRRGQCVSLLAHARGPNRDRSRRDT